MAQTSNLQPYSTSLRHMLLRWDFETYLLGLENPQYLIYQQL